MGGSPEIGRSPRLAYLAIRARVNVRKFDDAYYPQETLATSIRTDTLASTTDTRRPHECTNVSTKILPDASLTLPSIKKMSAAFALAGSVLFFSCADAALAGRLASAVARRFAAPMLAVESATATAGAHAKAELIAACSAAPRNGVGASEAEAEAVERAAKSLEAWCPAEPARKPLSGVWELVYTTSVGGSSGKVGPFVGAVTQTIVGEAEFVNSVSLLGGALRVALRAERQVLGADRIRVTFMEMEVSLFGRVLLRRPTRGSGVWKQRFVDETLRVMDTPSLFVLRKRD